MKIFRHRHRWRATGVEHVISPFSFTSINDHATTVLWHCRCSLVCSTEVRGYWTLDQIHGNSVISDGLMIYAAMSDVMARAAVRTEPVAPK